MLENDWLEAIIALPLNIFYNTGIATYIWYWPTRRPQARRGKGTVDRRIAVVSSRCAQPRQEELRTLGWDIQQILDLYLGEAQGNPPSRNGSTPGTWLLEDHRRAPAAPEKPALRRTQLSPAFCLWRRGAARRDLRHHGEALYSEFAKRKPAIEAWLKGEDENEDDDSEDSDSGDDSEAPAARKAVPAKRRKKLLDASTWQRDKGLMEVAQRAQRRWAAPCSTTTMNSAPASMLR